MMMATVVEKEVAVVVAVTVAEMEEIEEAQ